MRTITRKELVFYLFIILLVSVVLVSFIYFSYFRSDIPPSELEFNKEEKSYPAVTYAPQSIPDPQIRVGALVITSEPDMVNAILTTETAEEVVSDQSVQGVSYKTPFRIDVLPAGRYTVFAAKEGYDFQEVEVEIKANEVNRLHITLHQRQDEFLSTQQQWIAQLPIEENSYSITYDKASNVVRVTIRLPQNYQGDYQQLGQEIEDEARTKLRSLGINDLIQKVEWEIK